jgi:hypothetical protein
MAAAELGADAGRDVDVDVVAVAIIGKVTFFSDPLVAPVFR